MEGVKGKKTAREVFNLLRYRERNWNCGEPITDTDLKKLETAVSVFEKVNTKIIVAYCISVATGLLLITIK